MAGKIRTQVESQEYTNAFQKIGDAKELDAALAGLTLSISINPADWPIVPGFKDIRLAKTDATKDAPVLSIWFRVLDMDTIFLLYIEASKEV